MSNILRKQHELGALDLICNCCSSGVEYQEVEVHLLREKTGFGFRILGGDEAVQAVSPEARDKARMGQDKQILAHICTAPRAADGNTPDKLISFSYLYDISSSVVFFGAYTMMVYDYGGYYSFEHFSVIIRAGLYNDIHYHSKVYGQYDFLKWFVEISAHHGCMYLIKITIKQ